MSNTDIFRPHLHAVVKNVAFVCTTIILYSRPNWYALVKSCISVNHCVLLVRRHLKYVWFMKFTKFRSEVKNGSSLGDIQKQKTFSFMGLRSTDRPTRALPKNVSTILQGCAIATLPGSVFFIYCLIVPRRNCMRKKCR